MATFGGRVVLDPNQLNALLRGPDGPVARRMLEDGELVKREARRLVGVSKPDPVPRRGRQRRPGTLRDSIIKRLVTTNRGVAVQVGSDDPIALLHHEGTQPHVIEANKAPRLVFWSARAAKVVYAKRVRHPGTKPNRYLVNALRVLKGRY